MLRTQKTMGKGNGEKHIENEAQKNEHQAYLVNDALFLIVDTQQHQRKEQLDDRKFDAVKAAAASVLYLIYLL